MMADYARYYGGPPAPTLPWRLFRMLAGRTDRFEARAQLSLYDAVSSAIAASINKDAAAEATAKRHELMLRAYPVREVEPYFHANLFSPDAPEVAHG